MKEEPFWHIFHTNSVHLFSLLILLFWNQTVITEIMSIEREHLDSLKRNVIGELFAQCFNCGDKTKFLVKSKEIYSFEDFYCDNCCTKLLSKSTNQLNFFQPCHWLFSQRRRKSSISKVINLYFSSLWQQFLIFLFDRIWVSELTYAEISQISLFVDANTESKRFFFLHMSLDFYFFLLVKNTRIRETMWQTRIQVRIILCFCF